LIFVFYRLSQQFFKHRTVAFDIVQLHDSRNLVTHIVALRAKILDLGNVKASFAAALGLRILRLKRHSGTTFHNLKSKFFGFQVCIAQFHKFLFIQLKPEIIVKAF